MFKLTSAHTCQERRCVRCGRNKAGDEFTTAANICNGCTRPQHQFALNGIVHQYAFPTTPDDIEIASYLNNQHHNIADQLQQAIEHHRYFLFMQTLKQIYKVTAS
jgi:hypothetical protein